MKIQRPQVLQRTDRKGSYWFFRYWHDERLADGSIKTTRKFQTIGPSSGEDGLSRSEAEAGRDRIFAGRPNSLPPVAIALAPSPLEAGTILFGELAEMWRKDYV